MKRFLKKRWHSIPVGIVTAILLVCLIAGGVFAFYPFFSGKATVTVIEPMTVMYDGDPDWTWDGDSKTLTVGRLDPNTGIAPEWTVKNTGMGRLKITPIVDNPHASVNASWQPVEATLWGGESCAFCLWIFASGDAPPGAYTFDISFERGTP